MLVSTPSKPFSAIVIRLLVEISPGRRPVEYQLTLQLEQEQELQEPEQQLQLQGDILRVWGC